jgi:hypothetical protein
MKDNTPEAFSGILFTLVGEQGLHGRAWRAMAVLRIDFAGVAIIHR